MTDAQDEPCDGSCHSGPDRGDNCPKCGGGELACPICLDYMMQDADPQGDQ